MKIEHTRNQSFKLRGIASASKLNFASKLQSSVQTYDYFDYDKEDTVEFSAKKVIDLAKERNAIYTRLKDEDTLYNLYSGKDVGISENILNNEGIMKKLYQDPEFMKASVSALLRATDDKLKDDTLSNEDFEGLLELHNILSIQQELFDDPTNSFDVGLDKLSDKETTSIKKVKKLGRYQEPQPSFGTIFNLGTINKPKTRKRKAEAIVNRAAIAAAGESFALLAIPTPTKKLGKLGKVLKLVKGTEPVALSATTAKMCSDICETYQMPGGVATSLISRLTGALAGKAGAALLADILALLGFDAVGGAVNATVTYALHQVQGRSIIKWCEANYKNADKIEDWDEAVKSFIILRSIGAWCLSGPNPVDVLGEEGFPL